MYEAIQVLVLSILSGCACATLGIWSYANRRRVQATYQFQLSKWVAVSLSSLLLVESIWTWASPKGSHRTGQTLTTVEAASSNSRP